MALLLRSNTIILYAVEPAEIARAIKNGFKIVECWCKNGFQSDKDNSNFCSVCLHNKTLSCWTCVRCIDMLKMYGNTE